MHAHTVHSLAILSSYPILGSLMLSLGRGVWKIGARWQGYCLSRSGSELKAAPLAGGVNP
jgi:hypothetical protein